MISRAQKYWRETHLLDPPPEEVVADALGQLYSNQIKAEMVVAVMEMATAIVTTTAGGGGGGSGDDTNTLSTATMTVIAATTMTMMTTGIAADDGFFHAGRV